MMDSMLAALALAGFVLAHAMGIISEPPPRDLIPVAFVARGNDQQFITFEGTTLEEMVKRGKGELAAGGYDAWALAYEGYVVIGGERKNAVFVHAWRRGLTSPVVIAQAWGRAEDGATADFLGPAVLLTESSAPNSAQRTNADPVNLDERQLRVLAAGIEKYVQMSKTLPKAPH